MIHTLTPEQYGAAEGWRLLDADEQGSPFNTTPPLPDIQQWWRTDGQWNQNPYCGSSVNHAYRTKLSRAELRAARGLPPEKPSAPAWITDREPVDSDYPILVRYVYPESNSENISHYDITDKTQGRVPVPLISCGHMWVHWKDIAPAVPKPTQTERDEAAAYAFINNGLSMTFSMAMGMRQGFLAGVKYGRANP